MSFKICFLSFTFSGHCPCEILERWTFMPFFKLFFNSFFLVLYLQSIKICKKAAGNGNACSQSCRVSKQKRERSEFLFFQFIWQIMQGKKKYFSPKWEKNLFNNKLCYLHYEEITESHMLLLTYICSFSNWPRSSDGVTWGGKDSFDPFTVCSSAVQTQRSAAGCCVTAGLVRHSTPFYFRQEKSGGNIPLVILLSKILFTCTVTKLWQQRNLQKRHNLTQWL